MRPTPRPRWPRSRGTPTNIARSPCAACASACCCREIGAANGIEVSEQEMNRLIGQAAAQYQPARTASASSRYIQQEPMAAAQLRAPLYEDKVVDFLFSKADVTDRTVDPRRARSRPRERGRPCPRPRLRSRPWPRSRRRRRPRPRPAKAKAEAAEAPRAPVAKKAAAKPKPAKPAKAAPRPSRAEAKSRAAAEARPPAKKAAARRSNRHSREPAGNAR